MTYRYRGPMDSKTMLIIAIGIPMTYSAWLTSVVFCAAHGMRPLLIASATIFPVGIVHGIGIWFGGW